MLFHILFIVSFVVVLLVVTEYVAKVLGGVEWGYPRWEYLSYRKAWLFYPSILFQVWFWAERWLW